MAYHERVVARPLRDAFRIAVGEGALANYDLDAFGHDDGCDPDPEASFRLIFQLGQELMIFAYVVGMARPHDPRAFHALWLKDCAVAEIDVEERGPIAGVVVEAIELPVVFRRVDLLGPVARSSFVVERIDFVARPVDRGAQPDLEVGWRLRDDAGERASLVYASAGGWAIGRGHDARRLADDERIRFAAPC
ncbi:hypothetical protein ACNOYE_37545 [Nannocystaceae bacterium ST9]